MGPQQTFTIDCAKINKAHLYKGTKLDCVMWPNKDGGVGQYGDHGYITQSVPKEARDRGERGAIIGNWKWGRDYVPANMTTTAPSVADSGDEVPEFLR